MNKQQVTTLDAVRFAGKLFQVENGRLSMLQDLVKELDQAIALAQENPCEKAALLKIRDHIGHLFHQGTQNLAALQREHTYLPVLVES